MGSKTNLSSSMGKNLSYLMGRFNHGPKKIKPSSMPHGPKITAKKRLKKMAKPAIFFSFMGRKKINAASWELNIIPQASWEDKFIMNGASRSLSAHLRHSGETPRSGSVCAYFQRGHINYNIVNIYK